MKTGKDYKCEAQFLNFKTNQKERLGNQRRKDRFTGPAGPDFLFCLFVFFVC